MCYIYVEHCNNTISLLVPMSQSSLLSIVDPPKKEIVNFMINTPFATPFYHLQQKKKKQLLELLRAATGYFSFIKLIPKP